MKAVVAALVVLACFAPAAAANVDWGACPKELRDAQCAKVTVPLDYAQPGGRKLRIAISRLRTSDRAHRRGILLFNPGGPGGPGLDYPLELRAALKDVAARYDLIGFDPRMVGRSGAITCGKVRDQFESPGFERAGFDATVRTAADLARRCQERNAALLPHASTRNVARDMDAIRAALGERRLSYYGVSYGAGLGATYMQLFPRRADRIVLDSAAHLDTPSSYEAVQAAGAPSEAALNEWAAWTARRDGHFHLGRTAGEVRARVEQLIAGAASRPIVVAGHGFDDHELPLVLQPLLNDADNDAALARIVRTLVDAAAGRRVTPGRRLAGIARLMQSGAPELDRYVAADLAVDCLDGPWPRDPERYWNAIQASRATQPVFGPIHDGISACAFWGAKPEPALRIDNRVPALIVQALRENNTPYTGGLALRRRLSASRLVSVDIRAHGVYGRGADGFKPNTCAERVVNAYLRTGRLPRRDIGCAG